MSKKITEVGAKITLSDPDNNGNPTITIYRLGEGAEIGTPNNIGLPKMVHADFDSDGFNGDITFYNPDQSVFRHVPSDQEVDEVELIGGHADAWGQTGNMKMPFLTMLNEAIGSAVGKLNITMAAGREGKDMAEVMTALILGDNKPAYRAVDHDKAFEPI